MAKNSPSHSHPWRQYKNRVREGEEEVPVNSEPVHIFLSQILSNWENIEVYEEKKWTVSKRPISDLPAKRQVAWVTTLLKRQYGIQSD